MPRSKQALRLPQTGLYRESRIGRRLEFNRARQMQNLVAIEVRWNWRSRDHSARPEFHVCAQAR